MSAKICITFVYALSVKYYVVYKLLTDQTEDGNNGYDWTVRVMLGPFYCSGKLEKL